MSTGYFMELLNHYTVHLKLILHCTLNIWNLNNNLGGKIDSIYTWPDNDPTDNILQNKYNITLSPPVCLCVYVMEYYSATKKRMRSCHLRQHGWT